MRSDATGFPGRRACGAAQSGREAGGVRCDGLCLDMAGQSCDMLASATGRPSSPAIRMRVRPTVLRAKLSPAMPLGPGASYLGTSGRFRARSRGAGEPAAVQAGEPAAVGPQLLG
jgi:hypothetical protein